MTIFVPLRERSPETSAGAWNAVVIAPPFRFGHGKITEIDAVRAAPSLGFTVSLPPERAVRGMDGD